MFVTSCLQRKNADLPFISQFQKDHKSKTKTNEKRQQISIMAPSQDCKCDSNNCTWTCAENSKKNFQAATKAQDAMGNTQTVGVEGSKGNVKDNLRDAMRTDLEHKGTH
jgi:hypothetical protein